MIHPSDRQTDGQTDGRAIAYTCYSIYAVTRKNDTNRVVSFWHCYFGDAGLFIRHVWAALSRQVIVLMPHLNWIIKYMIIQDSYRCKPVWVRHYTHDFSVDTKR